MTKLPDDPSAMIRLALADLRKVEADQLNYVVDMTEWHTPPNHTGRCQVCLAGAVMAMTLKTSPWMYSSPLSYGVDQRKLQAINHFRGGYVYMGLRDMDRAEDAARWLREDPGIAHREVPPYDPNEPNAFHAAMGEMADELEMHGL